MRSILLFFVALLSLVHPCTDLIVGKGVSATGHPMFTYAADSRALYGDLYYAQAGTHDPAVDKREIIEWDTQKRLGEIPQVETTYNVVGNMNEHSLAIGESTWSGQRPGTSFDKLEDKLGKIDYGSLIYVALERCKNCQEAISCMTTLAAEHGYASHGESFTIADPNEVWILEMVGKGTLEREPEDNELVAWIAIKIPDDHVSGHANQGRIRTIVLDDESVCRYGAHTISFARKQGWFTEAEDSAFSFSDVYGPITFSGARHCDARVWSFFKKAEVEGMDQFEEYAKGKDLTQRMELSYPLPEGKKLSVLDLEELMGDHYEGTPLTLADPGDVGGGAWACPYRLPPLEWVVDGKTYCNERPIGTQQTAWSFIAECRPVTPESPLGGLFWFGTDDGATSVHIPFYASATKLPLCLYDPSTDLRRFSFHSLFWVSNLVANFAYTQYMEMKPEIDAKRRDFHATFLEEVRAADTEITRLAADAESGKARAIDYANAVAINWAETVCAEWLDLWKDQFMRYKDFNRMTPLAAKRNPFYEDISYTEPWRNLIAKYTGTHYLLNQPITTEERQ